MYPILVWASVPLDKKSLLNIPRVKMIIQRDSKAFDRAFTERQCHFLSCFIYFSSGLNNLRRLKINL